jgi:hypothetical protein
MELRSPRKLTLAKHRELQVAAAVAQDEIMQFHVASALRLIELAAGRVSAVRMVAIYLRMHCLGGSMAAMILNSALAALGQRASRGETASLVVEGEDWLARAARTLLRVLRGRARPRVHHDLRRTTEFAYGATQVGLLELHIQHALRFAHELADTHDTQRAVDIYSVMTNVLDSTRRILYLQVLNRLAMEGRNRAGVHAVASTSAFASHPAVA